MDVVVALLAVLSIALFFVVRFRLNAAVAPFFSVSLIILWLCLVCMTGLVVAGVWAVLLFAVFCLIWVFGIKKTPIKEALSLFFKPGMIFFLVSAVAFFVALGVLTPWFTAWDEFSFWGTAAKSIFEFRQIYTLQTANVHNSYPPALPLWSFFFQFFGREFTEWKVFLAYDVLMMSVMSLLFARVQWKNVGAILSLTLFGWGGLYLLWWTFDARVLYCTAYADIPIGVVFGGCVLAYYMLRDNQTLRWTVPMTGILMLAFMKDIGMALGLIAAAVIAVDMVFFSKAYPFENKLGGKKGWRLVFPAALFAAPLFSYFIWAIHFSAATTLSRAPKPYPYSVFDMLAGRDPRFLEVLDTMNQHLFRHQIVSFGTVIEMAVVFALIPILFGLLTWNRKRFLRLTAFSLLMTAGFFAYYYFHAYIYTTVFTFLAPDSLDGFGRYMTSYVAGWMIAVLGVCFSKLGRLKFKKMGLAPAAAVTLLMLCSNLVLLPVHPDQYVFLSSKVSLSAGGLREELISFQQRYEGVVAPEDRVYFVCQQTQGGEWYMFNYQYLPAYTVTGLGAGYFVPPDTPAQDLGAYQSPVGKEAFVAYLREQRVDLIYVQRIDDYFYREMGPLFSDDLSGVVEKTTPFYLVVDDGQALRLVAVRDSEHLAQLRLQYGLAEN